MTMIKKRLDSWYGYLIAGLTLLLYSAIVTFPIPGQIGLAARFSLIAVIAVITISFYLKYLLKWDNYYPDFVLIIILFSLSLAALWNTGISIEYVIIGGLLPSKHPLEYYLDAQQLLFGGEFSTKSSHRPLFSGMLSTVLWMTNQNLQLTLAGVVFISAVAAFWLIREVQNTHGLIGAVIVLIVLYLFYRNHIGSLMTENLGFALGTMGFALIWRAARLMSLVLTLLGIFLITLALLARAGAFFVLPMLILWGALVFKGKASFSTRFLVMGTGTVFMAFLINYLIFKTMGSPEGAVGSNFSLVLYGLVTGGNPWRQVMIDYPEIKIQGDVFGAAVSKQVYALALKAFLEDPSGLILGSVKSWLRYFSPTSEGMFAFVQYHYLWEKYPAHIIRILLVFLSIIGVLICFQKRKDPNHALLLAAFLGVVLSVPFLYADVGRIYAATVPVITILAALGAVKVATMIAGKMNRRPLFEAVTAGVEKQSRDASQKPVFFSAALIILVCCGPFVIKLMGSAPVFAQNLCDQPGQDTAYFRINPGSFITLVDDAAIRRTHLPFIRISDFRQGLQYAAPEIAQGYGALPGGVSITTAFDLIQRQHYFYLISKTSLSAYESRIVRACGRSSGLFFYADYVDPVPVGR